jgi:thiol-disulfide isomerase/thioredoxin
MRKIPVVIAVLVIGAIVLCPLTKGQSSPKRRTPALTSEDLGVTGREVLPAPTESEARPPARGEPEATRGSIAWHRDILRAAKVAQSEGKIIVVDIYTDWCGWCKKMDTTVYADPTIIALSKQQVFVKLNAEDRGQGQSFAQQMGVNGYPTTIILDGQGRVLDVAEGYIASAQAFVNFVERARTLQAR